MKYRILRKSSTPFDKVHEECGVFGIAAPEGKEISAAHDAYTALFALQHRGQEAAGIAVNKNGVIHCHKDVGLVSAYLQALANEGIATALVISHLPLVGYLVSELCPGETPPMFTTSAIASVTLDESGKGTFNWQMSPCNLKMAKAI